MSRLEHSVTPCFQATCFALFAMAVDHTSTPRHTSTRDHFRALELHCEANAEEIRSAYFRLVLTNHPDRNQGDPDAATRFKRVQQAYEVLSKRRTLTRTEHLLRTPFMADSFDVSTPACDGDAKATFAFSDSASRRRSDAVQVGQWLAAATVATALVAMLWGLSRERSLIATALGVGSTQFDDEALPTVNQRQIDNDSLVKIGPTPSVAAGNAARRADDTSAESRSRVVGPEFLADKDSVKALKSLVRSSLLNLRDTLIPALDEQVSPEEVVGRLLGLKHDQTAADDSRSVVTSKAEPDRRASISGNSRKPDITLSSGDSSSGDPTDDYSDLARSRRYVPINTSSELPEYERYGPREHVPISLDGAPANLSIAAVEPQFTIRRRAWSEIAPFYEQITPGAHQLPLLPESFARESMPPPPHIRAMLAGAAHAGDSRESVSSTTGAVSGGQFDGGKSKWSSHLPDGPWRKPPTKDRRGSQAHYERPGAGLTSHGPSPANNGVPHFSSSVDFRSNPRNIYPPSPPDRGLLKPHGTLQPADTGHYLRSQRGELQHELQHQGFFPSSQ